MAKDFLSDQIRIKSLIGSGSAPNPKITVYADTDAPDNEGTVPTNLLDNVGSDVFLFVSGTIDGKENNTDKSVTLFGGDVVVSGTLYTENHVVEVDAVSTGSLSVSGSIVHSGGINIGSAEDGGYTDGLFTDFTDNTSVGTAVDRFNEVLKGLAPRQAPELQDFSVTAPSPSALSTYLSFGSSNDQSPTYTSVAELEGYPAVDVNGLYESVSSQTTNNRLHHKLGVFRKTTNISGVLNELQNSDIYTNSVVNYPENSFSSANEGELKLFLNGNEIHSIDLTTSVGAGDPGSGTGSHLNSNGSGFTNLSTYANGKFASEQEFSTFTHRTGNWIVHQADQVNGFNYAQVKHVISGQTDKITGTAQWVNDDNNENLSVLSSALTLNLTGSKHISGVEYFTGGNADYSASISNFYKYTYSTNPTGVATSSIPSGASIAFPNSSVSQINTATEDHTKNLSVQSTGTISLPSSGRIITDSSPGIEVGCNVFHPYKSVNTAATRASQSEILIDNSTPFSNNTSEQFRDENYRLISTSYNSQSDVNNASNQWDSTQLITTGNSGYDDGLLVYNDKLMSTKNTGIINNGNFSTLLNGPTGNPDYSNGNISAGTKRYIRKYTNTTGSPVRDIRYNISGVGQILSHTTNLGSNNNNFKLYFKLPGSSSWLDASTDFIYNTINPDGSGGKIGSFISNISQNPNNYLTFGTSEVANNESILVKIESNKTWSGELDYLNVTFGAVGTVLPSPDTTNIDANDTGVTGNLSFGSNLSKTSYFNVTSIGGSNQVNVNDEYRVTSFSNNNRRGIFDGTVVIGGEINETTSSQGNNYPANAWGGGKANVGELKLEVNGVIIPQCTINLATFVSGNVLNANNTGFINITEALVGRDNANLPDYRYFYRTGSYQIDTSEQRYGWNYARVIHDLDGGTNVFETNYVEWVNSEYSSMTFTSLSIPTSTFVQGDTAPNYLSGINYFTSARASAQTTVSNAYKYVYDSSSSGISFPITTNSSIRSISVSGAGVINNTYNSSSSTLPDLDTSVSTAYDEDLNIDATFDFDISKSIPGSLLNAELSCRVKHPLSVSSTSNSSTSANPLIYTVNDTETDLVENFSAESYRLKDNVYNSQSDISSGTWSSTESLVGSNADYNTGLQVFDNKLIYPVSNFSNSTSLVGPSSNPDYSSSTGDRTFYRKFENNSGASKFGFSLKIKGTNATIVNNTTSLSGNNIHVFIKLPNTSNSQSTGFLDLATPFATGQFQDNDGCLDGSLTATISNSGQGTTNNVTFGTVYAFPGDEVVVKIVAGQNWSGDLNRIELVWS